MVRHNKGHGVRLNRPLRTDNYWPPPGAQEFFRADGDKKTERSCALLCCGLSPIVIELVEFTERIEQILPRTK
jgi:hypothetical protein